MKLHGFHGQFPVADPHDYAIFGFGGDLQAGGQPVADVRRANGTGLPGNCSGKPSNTPLPRGVTQ